jgi:hypothetical protein
VRFKTTPAFDSDSSSLTENEKQLFRASVKEFDNACNRSVESVGSLVSLAAILACVPAGEEGSGCGWRLGDDLELRRS